MKSGHWQLLIAGCCVLAWNAFLLWMVIYG